MNTCATRTTIFPGRWTRSLVTLIAVIVMLPLVVMAQTLPPNPAPVVLGTAGNFVALSKTGITTTGATHITGDIGVSPISAAAITGFALSADPSNVFSTSALVTGKVYAANYAAPTPSNLSTAVGNMEAAYTDAAGRSTNYTELYAGDLTGKTLTRGVYKWGSGVLVSAGGVTLSGSATDVWIFQIAQTLTVANGASVHLTGGASAASVFWQVGGDVSVGTTAAMNGVILGQTAIMLHTGASFNGRALAQTAVTLDANSVTDPGTAAPPPSNMPTISSVSLTAGNPGSVGLKVTITGTNFSSGATSLDFGAGVTVSGLVVNSATSMTANLTLSSSATAGTRTITVTNSGSGGGSATMPSGFTVGTGAATTVEQISTVPSEFELDQNYPNPFNPSTTIQYSLATGSQVSLKVYNMIGNEVATLVNGHQEAGSYSVSFNTGRMSVELPSGVYFYRIEAGAFVSTKKLTLLK